MRCGFHAAISKRLPFDLAVPVSSHISGFTKRDLEKRLRQRSAALYSGGGALDRPATNARGCAKIVPVDHLHYMQRAFEDARQAYAAGNRPVAALIVRDDVIISAGRNTVYAEHDPSAHAEVAAIRVACRKLDTLDLSGATLYSTLEPCPMCLWMILETKIARVVLGARHAALKRADIGDYSVETFLALTRRPLEVVTGVLEQPCVDLRLQWMQEQSKRTASR